MRPASVFRAVGLMAVLAAVSIPAPLSAESRQAVDEMPAAVADRFLQAFAKKDFQTIRTLFAPGAVVSVINLARQGSHDVSYMTPDQWMGEAEKSLGGVTFTGFEQLDTSTLSFDQGATVSVRFRATGKAGDHAFTGNGIDTYSMIKVDGAWRILRYGTFELIDF